MKKIFNSRALALILVLAMAVSLFTFSVSAATSWSLTGHGTNVASITIDGADAGKMKTNLGGKLSLSVELGDHPVDVKVTKC